MAGGPRGSSEAPLFGSRKKCLWCNHGDGELREFTVVLPNRFGLDPRDTVVVLHPAHEPEARRFLDAVARHAKRFVLGVAAVIVLAWIGIPILLVVEHATDAANVVGAVYFGPLTIGLGLLTWRYPFATPETVRWFGIRTAVRMVRLFAVAIIGFGVWLILSGLG